jgi:hypothetical protein
MHLLYCAPALFGQQIIYDRLPKSGKTYAVIGSETVAGGSTSMIAVALADGRPLLAVARRQALLASENEKCPW